MPEDGLGRRETVWRQLHNKRRVVALDDPAAQDACHDDCQEDADGIERHHDEALVAHGEEGCGYHDVYGQSCRAGHHGQHEHGDESRAASLDGACGHDGRHVAAESHDERDERLAVQAHAVHQLVHDEGSTGHISRVLHEGDEGVEDEYLGQEYDDGAHAAYDAVDEHGLQRPVAHVTGNEIAQPFEAPLYPVHRVLAEGKRYLEHQEQQGKEDGESQPAVGDDAVEPMGGLVGVALLAYHVAGLVECAAHKAILGIHNRRLGIVARLLLYTAGRQHAGLTDLCRLGQVVHHTPRLAVVLQQFDSQPARRISQSQQIVAFQEFLYVGYTFFYLVTMVDMDVSVVVVVALLTLEDVDDLAQQVLHSPARLERRGHHGHTH